MAKRGLLLIFFLFLLVPLVIGTDFEAGEFGHYQNTDGHTGLVANMLGYWHNNFGTETDSASGGTDLQPLAIDTDNDGQNELVTASGSNIQFWEINSNNVLSLTDQVSVSTAVTAQFSSTHDYDGNGYPEIIAVTVTGAFIIEYDGTNYVVKASDTTAVDDPVTGIACETDQSVYECVFGSDTDVCVYMLADNSVTCTLAGASGLFTTDRGLRITPAVVDFDRDGFTEAIFVGDNNSNDEEGIIIWELNTSALDTGFGNGGVIDDYCEDYIGGVLVRDIDAGDKEIIFTCNQNSSVTLRSYDSSGTIGPFFTYSSNCLTQDCNVGTPVYVPQTTSLSLTPSGTQDSGPFICYAWTTATGPSYNLYCVDADHVGSGTEAWQHSSGTTVLLQNASQNMITARMLGVNSTTNYDLVIGNYIVHLGNVSNNVTTTDYNTDDEKGSNVIVADLNNDNNLDICGMTNNKVFCSFANYANNNPNLLTRNYGQNFQTPVCLDTTVTFTAEECGTEPCHYTNDLSADKERLVSTCGNQTENINGTFHLNSPTLGCTYSSVGNYQFKIYLQDESNTANFTEYKTVELVVVNGTAQRDCNFPVSSEVLEGKNITTVTTEDQFVQEEDFLEVTEAITGQSAFVKLVLVLMFTFAVFFALIKAKIFNPFVYYIVMITLWLAFAMFGFLNWIYVIILGLLGVLAVVAGYLVFGNSGNGNG